MARLNRAIAASKTKYDVSVSWLPFFLRPNMPKAGKLKGGTPASRVGGWLHDINAKEAPEIKFTGMCDRYPNTEQYHVALEQILKAHGAATQHKFAQRVFEAYYRDGIYPDATNLTKLAQAVVGPSVDAAALSAAMKDQSKCDAVYEYAQELSAKYSVRGVPYFIVNDHPAFSGAQETDNFLHAFEVVPELNTAAA